MKIYPSRLGIRTEWVPGANKTVET